MAGLGTAALTRYHAGKRLTPGRFGGGIVQYPFAGRPGRRADNTTQRHPGTLEMAAECAAHESPCPGNERAHPLGLPEVVQSVVGFKHSFWNRADIVGTAGLTDRPRPFPARTAPK